MGVFSENAIIGASAAGGYDIDQSLRFEDGDSSELVRSVTVAGNRRTSTWSAWVKIGWSTFSNDAGTIEPTHTLFCCGNSDGRWNVGFSNATAINNNLPQLFIGQRDSGGAQAFEVSSTQAFRDPSAWYHIVVVMDTTQSTNTDRVKAYINGERITDWGVTSWPSQNYDSDVFRTADPVVKVRVGSTVTNSNTGDRFWDGYIAEVNVVDGTALTPASFGETNSDTNQWQAIKYAGSYGTNGFYLKFQNSSALGDDSSGNTNDFTVTNLAATDQVLDSPTNNFATLNPLIKSNGTLTYSEGNLKIVAGSNWNNAVATISAQSGKWYMEFLAGSSNTLIGVIGDETERWWNGAGGNPQDTTTGQILYYGLNGNKRIDGSDTSYGNSYTDGDIIGIALNLDDSEITFYKNGTAQNSGTAISFSGNISNSSDLAFAFATYSATSYANFGQDSSFAGAKTAQGNGGVGEDFYYTPPTGYKSLATKSIDDPSIADPTAHFDTKLYTGTGGTKSISSLAFAPDFTWIKSRSNSSSNALFDTVRGATKELISNDTAAEQTFSDSLTAFNSDGFTLGADTSGAHVNVNTYTYVSWNWKAGGAASSNGNGTITSSVSANSTVGFSIVSYTGQSAAGTVGHGLSQAPEMIILKNRDQGVFWAGYVEALGNTKSISLNDSGASYTEKTWNDTSPTSTVFSIGAQSETSSGRFNVAGEKFIAYCFHSVDGYSKVGSYEGNGNADGSFIYLGFKPEFFLIKNVDAVEGWEVWDGTRETYNKLSKKISPNTNDAEYTANTTTYAIDFLSNGVKLRTSYSAVNGSNTFLYYAVASSPFKTSNAR